MLLFAFGVRSGCEEFVGDAVDGFAVETAAAPYVLVERAVGSLFEPAVQANHGWSVGIGFLLELCVESLGLGLRDAFRIVVAGGSEQEVLTVGLIDALGHDVGIEDDVREPFRINRQVLYTYII